MTPLDTSAALNLDVWIDRARVIRRRPGARVDGETQVATATSAWFRCRIPPRSASETDEMDKRPINDTYQVSASLFYEGGGIVDVQESDRIELESPAGENSTMYEVRQVFIPRNGQGSSLLVVMELLRIVER